MCQPMICRKCENDASYRPDLRGIFNAQPAGPHTRRSLFDQLVAGGACCNKCCLPNDLSMSLYYLRQDGLVELFARGMFRRRLSDATTIDFIERDESALDRSKALEVYGNAVRFETSIVPPLP